MRIAEIIVPASRSYLSNQDGRARGALLDRCDEATAEVLADSLERVCATLATATTSELAIHAIDCPSVAQHEQALVMAVRALQSGNEFGYTAAMTAVVRPSAVRVMRADMQRIALALIRVVADRERGALVSTATLAVSNPGAALLH